MRINDRLTARSDEGTGQLRLAGTRKEGMGIPFESLSHNSRTALNAVDDVSRRIDDLASKLGCLGYFDQGDGPRAA